MAATTERPLMLESGDRLTRAEFHRRYCARPDISKAELVQGVVYVASPIRTDVHGDPHALVILWLGVYAAKVPGLRLSDNGTVYLDDESEVQPDAFLYWRPEQGVGARLNDEGYAEGAPALVVEVAASSASYDLHDKKEAYRRAGVPEYIVWRILDKQIDWFRLRNGDYTLLLPDADGRITSEVFPGLRLPVATTLAGDAAGLLGALDVRI